MENIELKLECRDLALARSICRSYGAVHAGVLDQTDTYYRVADGRLKKRETAGEETEFVHYHRADAAHARASSFSLFTEKEARERFGAMDLPVWVAVRKRRELFLLSNVRIHLDDVEGLGRFVEFEALVSSSQGREHCLAEIAALREVLGPALGEPVAVSYSDLAAQAAEDRNAG